LSSPARGISRTMVIRKMQEKLYGEELFERKTVITDAVGRIH